MAAAAAPAASELAEAVHKAARSERVDAGRLLSCGRVACCAGSYEEGKSSGYGGSSFSDRSGSGAHGNRDARLESSRRGSCISDNRSHSRGSSNGHSAAAAAVALTVVAAGRRQSMPGGSSEGSSVKKRQQQLQKLHTLRSTDTWQ
jgi:hypothetical protein